MKNPEKYIQEYWNDLDLTMESIIQKAQEDAIEEACFEIYRQNLASIKGYKVDEVKEQLKNEIYHDT